MALDGGAYKILEAYEIPLVTVKLFRGASTPEQRADLIAKLTDTVAEWIADMGYEKENIVPLVWCIIEDVEFGSWGAGGKAITPQLLKAAFEGKT